MMLFNQHHRAKDKKKEMNDPAIGVFINSVEKEHSRKNAGYQWENTVLKGKKHLSGYKSAEKIKKDNTGAPKGEKGDHCGLYLLFCPWLKGGVYNDRRSGSTDASAQQTRDKSRRPGPEIF